MRMLRLMICIMAVSAVSAVMASARGDSVAAWYSCPLGWRAGVEANPAWVAPGNKFLRGFNRNSKPVDSNFSGSLRADFRFSPYSAEGLLYKGLYQGVGVGINTFFDDTLLGTPVAAYILQGAPIISFSRRLWLGYEWRFGAAFGWNHYHKDQMYPNLSVSTDVTAMLGLGLKLNYELTDRWQVSAGVNATHYSNGNTSLPNSGINTVGATIGMTYAFDSSGKETETPTRLAEEADRGRWMYDIMAYGAWRRHTTNVEESPHLCPGRFGVVGVQLMPLRRLNRWFAAGPSLDLQWDEGAGLDPYWIPGTSGDGILFSRPPFGKQISAGVSAHAELTMPIFTVDAGIGYDFVSPQGARRFYQSLTLKTFLTRRLYLNVGYRLGNFKDPQNLMLGVGVRL